MNLLHQFTFSRFIQSFEQQTLGRICLSGRRRIEREKSDKCSLPFPKGEFEKRYESIRSCLRSFTAARYWEVQVMFVLLRRSKNLIRQIRRINADYRNCVLSRCPDFEDKLQLCE